MSSKNNTTQHSSSSGANNNNGVQQLSFKHLRRQSKTVEIDAYNSPSNNFDSDAVQAFDAGADDNSSDSRSSTRNGSPSASGVGVAPYHHSHQGRLYQQYNNNRHRESSSSGTNSDHHSATSPRNTSVTKLLLRIDETMEAKQQQQQNKKSNSKMSSPTHPNQSDSNTSINTHGASVSIGGGGGGVQREGSTLGSSAILSPKLQSGSLRLASITTTKSSGAHGYNNNNNTPTAVAIASSPSPRSTSDGGDVAADIAGYTDEGASTSGKKNNNTNTTYHNQMMLPPAPATGSSNNNNHVRSSMSSSYAGGGRHPSAGSQSNLKTATHAINATHRMSVNTGNNLRRQPSHHNNNNNGGGHTPNSRNASPLLNSFQHANNNNNNTPLDVQSEGGFNSFLGEDELGSLFTPRGGGNDDDDTASLFSTYASAFPTTSTHSYQGGYNSSHQRSPSIKKIQGHYPHIAPLKVSNQHDVPVSGRRRRKSSSIRRKSSLIPVHEVQGGVIGGGEDSHSSKKKKGPQSSSSTSSSKVSKRFVTRIVQTTICLLISLAILCIVVLVVGIAIMGQLQSTLEDKLVASLNTASSSSSTTTTSSPSSSSSIYVVFGSIISDSVGDAKTTFTRVGVGLVGGFVAVVATIAILWVLCYVLHRRRRHSKKLAVLEEKKKAIKNKENVISSATVFISDDSNQNTPVTGSLLLPPSKNVGGEESSGGGTPTSRRKSRRSVAADSAPQPAGSPRVSVVSFAGRLIDAFVSSSSSSFSDVETEINQTSVQSPASQRRRSSATSGTPATTPHGPPKLKSHFITSQEGHSVGGDGVSPTRGGGGAPPTGGALTSDRLTQILSNQDMASIFSNDDSMNNNNDDNEDDDPLNFVGTNSNNRGRVSPGVGGGGSSFHSGKNPVFSDDECESIIGADSSMIDFLPSIGGGNNINNNNNTTPTTMMTTTNQKANLKLVRGTVLLVTMTNLLPATVASATTSFAFPSNIPTWLNEEGNAVGLFVSKFEDEFLVRAVNKPATIAVPDSAPVKNPITALSSSQLSDIISRFVSEVSTIVEKFGGVIDCTSPTEIVATFNYHARIVQHEDVACRCAIMIDSALREVLLDWIRVVVVVSTGNNLVGLLSGTTSGGAPPNQINSSSQSPTTKDLPSQSARRTRSKADKSAFVSANQQATSHHRLLAGESLDLCRKIVPLCIRQLHARVIVTDTTLTKSDLVGIPIDVIEPHWETRMESNTTATTPQFQPALSMSPQLIPTATFNDDGVTTGSIYAVKSGRGFGASTGPPGAGTTNTATANTTKTVTLYELVPGGLKKRKATAEVRDLTSAFLFLRRLKFSEARAKYAMYRFVNYQAYRLASFCEFMMDNVEQYGIPEGVTRYSRREIHWEDPTVATDAFSFTKGSGGGGGGGSVGAAGFSGSIVVHGGGAASPAGIMAVSDNPILHETRAAQNASIATTTGGGVGGSSSSGGVAVSVSPHLGPQILPTPVNGGGDSTTATLPPFAPRHEVPPLSSQTPHSISPLAVRRGSVPVVKVLSPSQWLALVCSAAIARDSITQSTGTNTNGTTSSPSLAAAASINVSALVGTSSSAISGLQQKYPQSDSDARTSVRAEMLISFGSMLGVMPPEIINNTTTPINTINIPSDHPVVRYRQSLKDNRLESGGASLTSPLQAGIEREGNQMMPFAGWTSPVVVVPGIPPPLGSSGSESTTGGMASGILKPTAGGGGTESDGPDTSQETTATVNRSGHHYLPAAAIAADPQTQSASDAYLEAIMGIDDVASPTKQPLTNPYHNNREVGLASPTMSWRGPGGFGSRRPSVSISETSGTGFRPTASNLRNHHAALNARNGGGGGSAMPSFSAATASLNGSTSSRKSLQQDLDDSHASIHITRRRIVELQAANQKKKQKDLVEQVAEEDNALFSIFVDTAGGDESANDSDTSKRSSVVPTGTSKRSKKSKSKKDKKHLSNSSLQNNGTIVEDDDLSRSDTTTSSSFNDDSTSSEGSVTSQGGVCSPTRIKAFVGENNDIPAVIRDVTGHRYHLSSKCLGKGAFGEVFLAMDAHGTLLATKIFRLAAAAGNAAQWAAAGNAVTSGNVSDSMTPEDRQKLIADQQINANARATAYTLMNEVEVLAQLRHPNIASYVSCAVVGKEGQYFAMMMEFLAAGSLRSMMDDQHFGGILPPSNFPQQPQSQQPTLQVNGPLGPMTPQQHPRAAVLSLAEALEDTDSDEEAAAAAAAAASAQSAALALPRKHRGGGVGGHRVLPRPAVLSYIKDVLKGIAFLHEHQYVHCDIKPENVLLTAEGTCKLADFGTAKLMDDYDITGGLPQDDGEEGGVRGEDVPSTPAIGPRVQTANKGGATGAGRVWGGVGAPPPPPISTSQQQSVAMANASSKESDAFGSVSHLGVGGGVAGSSVSSVLQINSGPTSPNNGDIAPSASIGLGAYTSEEEEERQRVLGAMVRGTPRYMAPEAVLGTFTPAADMFSLGVLVVELVTGEHPWAHVTGSDTTFMMRLARDDTMKPKVYRHLFYTPRSRPQGMGTLPEKSSGSDPLNPNSEQAPKSTSLPWEASLRSIPDKKRMPLDVSCSSSLGDEAAAGEDDDDFFFNLMNKADTDDEDSMVTGESPCDLTSDVAAASGEWLTSSTSASTTLGLTREAIRRRSLAASNSQVLHSGKKRQSENRKSNLHLKASNTTPRRARDVERERRRKERRRQRRRMGQRYIDDHIGKVLFHVVRRCLHRNPEHRPSVHQLLEWLGAE